MGHINQYIFLSKICNVSIDKLKLINHGGKNKIESFILEIGSKNYGNTENFRSLFPECHYIGIDIAEGDGVDVVIDLTATDPPAHWREMFDLIVCCSILEHTPAPWILAQKLTELLKKNGMIYISVPWVWRYHKYPDDYFRYSPSGVRSLFRQIEFEKTYFSTYIPGEFVDIGKDAAGKDDALALYKDIGQNRRRKYLPYLSVEMFGRKAE